MGAEKRKRGQSVWTPERRAAASARARAQKLWLYSTGPKTDSGKSRSRYNAYKHGRHSAAQLKLRHALAEHSLWLRLCLAMHKSPRLVIIPLLPPKPSRSKKAANDKIIDAQKNILFRACSLYPHHIFGFTESIKVRSFPLILLTLLFSFAFSMQAKAQADLSVNSLRIGTYPDKTRIVIDVSKKVDFRAFMLEKPPRLVIDLPAFDWRAIQTLPPKGSLVQTIRHGVLEPGIQRIVVDLDSQATLKSAFFLPSGPGISDRVVIDFSVAGAGYSFAQERMFGTLTSKGGGINIQPALKSTPQTQPQSLQSPLPEPQPQEMPPMPKSGKGPKPLIVIDPGHGGQDPGAIGANGTQEKNVTLATAQELKRQLENTGRYRVHLTRSSDKFIKLQDRVAIGREKGADLFISLHADSIDKPGVSGASIYTLSNKASDAQTAKLAARENRADLIAGVDLSHEDKQVANILIDLAMRDTMNQSKFFANTVVKNAERKGIQMLEKPHRFAGFAVLKAPDVPSVLIEMGFMSNKREVSQLSSPAYREKIAASILGGIDAYFAKVQKNGQN